MPSCTPQTHAHCDRRGGTSVSAQFTASRTCASACVCPRKQADATEAQSSVPHALPWMWCDADPQVRVRSGVAGSGGQQCTRWRTTTRRRDGAEQPRRTSWAGEGRNAAFLLCSQNDDSRFRAADCLVAICIPDGCLGPESDAKCLRHVGGTTLVPEERHVSAAFRTRALNDAGEKTCTAMRLWGRWVGEATELTASPRSHMPSQPCRTTRGWHVESTRHLGVQGFQVHPGCMFVRDRLAVMPRSPTTASATAYLSYTILCYQPPSRGHVVFHHCRCERRECEARRRAETNCLVWISRAHHWPATVRITGEEWSYALPSLTTRCSPCRRTCVGPVLWNRGREAGPALPRPHRSAPSARRRHTGRRSAGSSVYWFARVAYSIPLGLHQRLPTAMLQPAGCGTGRPVHRDRRQGATALRVCYLFPLLRSFPGVSSVLDRRIRSSARSRVRLRMDLLGLLFWSEPGP